MRKSQKSRLLFTLRRRRQGRRDSGQDGGMRGVAVETPHGGLIMGECGSVVEVAKRAAQGPDACGCYRWREEINKKEIKVRL